MVEGVGHPVLAASNVMGRETVYLCYDFSGFSKADEIEMQTNPEGGTLQQTS